MRGEEVDALSRELQVPAHQIARWREEFLSAGTDALKARARGPDRGRLRAAQAKVGELAMQVEILQELFQKRAAPASSGDAAALLVSHSGTPRPLALVCRTIGLARSSAYAARRPLPLASAKRGPRSSTSDDELLARIREILDDATFSGEGHRKVWARLRRRHGIRVSRKRVLRLMRGAGLLAPARRRWTQTPEEGWAWVFVAIDHRSLEPWARVRKRGDRFAALEPVLEGVRSHFGGCALNIARGLALRHDHGPQYVSDHFQGELRWLGITDSPAFVREPEGNGMAEWFIKQLKEQILWCERFATVEEADRAVREFCRRFREEWIVERLGYRTPAEAYAAFIAERAA